MGCTYEVSRWADVEGEGYQYLYVYQGESAVKAVFAFFRARKSSGCVRFVWRG